MFGEIGIIIGQAFSIVGMITGFVSFQMKTAKGILLFQIITAMVFAAHYFLIGAPTAIALNLLAVLQCICYYIRNKRNSKSLFLPIFFSVVVLVTGILTWDNWYSGLITLGVLVNAVAFSLSNPQTIRKLTLIKSPLCLGYNCCVWSTGGIVFEVAVLTSAIIGIIRGGKDFEKV